MMSHIALNEEFLKDLCKYMLLVLRGEMHAQQLNLDFFHSEGKDKTVYVFVCDEQSKDAFEKVLDFLYGQGKQADEQV